MALIVCYWQRSLPLGGEAILDDNVIKWEETAESHSSNMPNESNLHRLFSDCKKTCKKAIFMSNLRVFVLTWTLEMGYNTYSFFILPLLFSSFSPPSAKSRGVLKITQNLKLKV